MFVHVAAVRLIELAAFSRGKAVELGKLHLRDDAASYERDATYLEALRGAAR